MVSIVYYSVIIALYVWNIIGQNIKACTCIRLWHVQRPPHGLNCLTKYFLCSSWKVRCVVWSEIRSERNRLQTWSIWKMCCCSLSSFMLAVRSRRCCLSYTQCCNSAQKRRVNFLPLHTVGQFSDCLKSNFIFLAIMLFKISKCEVLIYIKCWDFKWTICEIMVVSNTAQEVNQDLWISLIKYLPLSPNKLTAS